ncbi:histidine phosphatase family protein [Microvirga calopogonii]|uniref:histidine phosphatase family protein n=1 Tax=Microvirga calopogonii TaxID=2078013 RepID=UPI000E0D3EC4|nr:histidine phosphatase family protein [Microvirga calopogonii]
MTDSPVRVAFVRHGETEWNVAGLLQGHAGPGLSAAGIGQVTALADALSARRQVATIVSSDLPRASETASILQYRLAHASVHLDPAWREVDVGSWSGRTMAEIARDDPGTLRAWLSGEDIRRGGGETRAETLKRVTGALAALVSGPCAGRAGTMVVVSHAGPIRFLAAAFLGLWPNDYRRLKPPGTASVTELEIDARNGAICSGRLMSYGVQIGGGGDGSP